MSSAWASYVCIEEREGENNLVKKSVVISSDSDMRKRGSMASLSGLENGAGSKLVKKFEAVRETYTPVKAKMKLVKHFIENYRQHIFFLILFYGVCVGLFAERFYCEFRLHNLH